MTELPRVPGFVVMELIQDADAACALGHSSSLLTFNAKHYRVISGLRLEQPYKR